MCFATRDNWKRFDRFRTLCMSMSAPRRVSELNPRVVDNSNTNIKNSVEISRVCLENLGVGKQMATDTRLNWTRLELYVYMELV